MADEADVANDTAELHLQAALKRQREACLTTPKGIGMCLNCASAILTDARWCDAECRDDWTRLQVQRTNRVATDE